MMHTETLCYNIVWYHMHTTHDEKDGVSHLTPKAYSMPHSADRLHVLWISIFEKITMLQQHFTVETINMHH